ncbi:hypothetical protein PR202_gb16134 [Eleusine coracana subsp. coracana]|uniref:Serpin domain-containing protein n=1 Tax=Eleusine coracana subsp. coracana TaxID=191504 RepID=A0AAV5EZN2_ELECO|nr:hypothetical protein PR202_gb16120 [Eleusine coracana subsp. coracana]GJN28053.1 hypothetical protein PR202_gb16134 [Eleusine coracana subsp. coracana]
MVMEDEFDNWDLYNSQQPKFSMCVFLPNKQKGPRNMVERIASAPEFMRNHMPMGYVPVGEFRLPKSKLTFERDIVDDLKALGLYLPFDKEKANMTGMHMTWGGGGALVWIVSDTRQ